MSYGNFDPRELPMYPRRGEFAEELIEHRRLVLIGPTGSGKTSLAPGALLNSRHYNGGQIWVAVPRKVLARAAAKFAAHLYGGEVGDEIGYAVRFDHLDGDLITYMTEGLLFRRMLNQPNLPGVGAVIWDEAHEESTDGLVGQGVGKVIQETTRPDLLIGVMSATLDADRYGGYWNCPVMNVAGRQYPVNTVYAPELTPEGAVLKIMEEAPHGVGTILLFEIGAREVNSLVRKIRGLVASKAEVLPFYSELEAAEQDLVLRAPTGWRIVVATNALETGITLPGGAELGVKYVVDLGLAKISRFDPRTQSRRLPVERICWNSANQRAGRAGRDCEGTCFRLYSKDEPRQQALESQLRRDDLSYTLLQLHTVKLDKFETFDVLDKPAVEDILTVEAGLQKLGPGAIDANRAITTYGEKLATLPLSPQRAAIVLAADECGSLAQALTIMSLKSGKPIFARPPIRKRRRPGTC